MRRDSAYEFSPDIVGPIPLDDRPRLLWRAFYRVYRALRNGGSISQMAGPGVVLAADHIFVHEPFRSWWRFCSIPRRDPLEQPVWMRMFYFQDTGKTLISRRR